MSVEKDFPFAELVPKIWITNKYFKKKKKKTLQEMSRSYLGGIRGVATISPKFGYRVCLLPRYRHACACMVELAPRQFAKTALSPDPSSSAFPSFVRFFVLFSLGFPFFR